MKDLDDIVPADVQPTPDFLRLMLIRAIGPDLRKTLALPGVARPAADEVERWLDALEATLDGDAYELPALERVLRALSVMFFCRSEWRTRRVRKGSPRSTPITIEFRDRGGVIMICAATKAVAALAKVIHGEPGHDLCHRLQTDEDQRVADIARIFAGQ